MRYLIEAAEEEGLNDIVGLVSEFRQVHGIIVDVHPLWFYLQYLSDLGINEPRIIDEIIYLRRFFGQANILPVSPFQVVPSFTSGKLNLTRETRLWKEFGLKSNLLVKILLRLGSKPVELKYQGRLNILQEHRSVPRLSASSAIPLEGGVSIGYGGDAPGTLGGILTDISEGAHYGVTCGHVICAKGHTVHHPSSLDSMKATPIGTCVLSKSPSPSGEAKCNAYNKSVLNDMDIALIQLDKSVTITHSIHNIGTLHGFTPSSELAPNLAIEFNGRSSKYKSLVTGGIGLVQEVIDANGKLCCFKDLIEVKQPTITQLAMSRPVRGGDSGSWLVTQGNSGNEWCGMIIAEDRQTGYALMAEPILDFLAANGYPNLSCH